MDLQIVEIGFPPLVNCWLSTTKVPLFNKLSNCQWSHWSTQHLPWFFCPVE